MTPIEFLFLTLIAGFGIRAGWFVCDMLIDAVPACIDAIERWRYRGVLAEPAVQSPYVIITSPAITGPSRTVSNVEHPIEYAQGGVVKQPIGGMLVGEALDDCFVRPRSHG